MAIYIYIYNASNVFQKERCREGERRVRESERERKRERDNINDVNPYSLHSTCISSLAKDYNIRRIIRNNFLVLLFLFTII